MRDINKRAITYSYFITKQKKKAKEKNYIK